MQKDKQFKTDNTDNLNVEILKHGDVASGSIVGKPVNFSVEPSGEKDYDIYLMTGNNNEKGSEKK